MQFADFQKAKQDRERAKSQATGTTTGSWYSGHRDRAVYDPTRHEVDESAFGFGGQGDWLLGQMQDRAAGNAPSVAELQMQQGLGQQLAASQSMMRSSPTLSPALAQRLAGQRMGEMMGQSNLQMGQLRAQEQAQAEQQMLAMLEAQRKGAMGLESMQAGQSDMYNQLQMQKAIANATGQATGGMGGSIMSGLGTLGAALLL